ncbi:hypothetical protein BDW66DRAFT_156271 [Aspergillus desertorum]
MLDRLCLPARIPNAQSQTLAECIIWHAPDMTDPDTDERKFNFSLPLPGNTPPTADTVLGPIRIQRLAPPERISHVRTYPGSAVVTKLCIAPHPSDAKRAGNKAQYNLQWQARSTIIPGARDSEVKYVVAKEVRWRVDETVKCLSLVRHENGPDRREIIGRQQHTRQLCQGEITGRWMASSGCRNQVDEIGAGGLIEIPFQVRIPTAVDEVDVSLYHGNFGHCDGPAQDRKMLAITVSHQLHLEVVTGEDTFHRGTGDLVERRACVKSYKAVFAMPVRDAAETDFNQLRATTRLPKYGDPYPALPDYSREGSDICGL